MSGNGGPPSNDGRNHSAKCTTWWLDLLNCQCFRTFQNHSAAQGWCGYFYVNGIAVPQDYVEAYAWHNVSAANDPSNAGLREFRSKVMDLMTKEQIADGQKRSTELRKEIEAAQSNSKSATNQGQGNSNNDANKKSK